jgi:hypothetical protein
LWGASQSRDLRASKLNFVELYRRPSENAVRAKLADYPFHAFG